MTKEKMRTEALSRLKVLAEKFALSPKIREYFKEGRVYYSYLTAMGAIPSIDSIAYDPRYEALISAFETEYHCLCYHAIETETFFGKTLSLLYVSEDEEDWDAERLCENYMAAYVVNLTYPDLSEFGDIFVSESEPCGALLRIS